MNTFLSLLLVSKQFLLSRIRHANTILHFLGYVDVTTLLSHQRTVHTIDFSLVDSADLKDFKIDFEFTIERTGKIDLLHNRLHFHH